MTISKKDIIYWCTIIVLILLLAFSVKQCQNTNLELKNYENNIEALNDTIKYYQDKNGNLVATKLAFACDIQKLELLNKELYEELIALKAKGNINTGIIVDGYIENPVKDTTYIINVDTISNGFDKAFAFIDEYRTIEGNVEYHNDSLDVFISKDIVKFDYTIAMDNDNNIMIKSSNPYVKYNELSGFQVPKEKEKHWSIGPSINFGYDPFQNKPTFDIGVSVSYGLFKF